MAGKKQTGRKGQNGLNDAQRRFCQEYVLDFKATSAAVRAGYSEKAARVYAFKLLRRPDVKAEIGRLQRKAAKSLEIDHTDLLRRLWETATADVNDLIRVERRAWLFSHGSPQDQRGVTAARP